MPLSVASKVVDFAYSRTPPEEKVEVGFFGGEPLLEFDLVQRIAELFESHPAFDACRVPMTLVTNGTIFSTEIADFLNAHNIGMGISCDGPPEIQDANRRFPSGGGTGALVETTIRRALEAFSAVMVNAVYDPRTLEELPRTIDYFSELGVRQIYLNPDFTAAWGQVEIAMLPEVFDAIGKQYVEYTVRGDPHFISPIDSKIGVILRGGYNQLERCRMGRGEYAFTPAGTIFPCERLVGDGVNEHCIGSLDGGIHIERLLCRRAPGDAINRDCIDCALRDHCMNWCGCSNLFSTGFYNRVSPFLCASEKAAIQAAFEALETLERKGEASFFDHLGGVPVANSLGSLRSGTA
jgi:uncharacterized protein